MHDQPTAAGAAPDRVERLCHGERWFMDGFHVLSPPGGLLAMTVDMGTAAQVVTALRQRGLRATYTHVIIRAAALALSRNPEAHQIVCGYRRVTPGQVDIGLSVAGQTTYAPVLVIPAAERLPLVRLVSEVIQGVERTRVKEEEDLAGMRRNGWIIPLGFLRRLILRFLGTLFWFRRRIAGTFQITCVPQVDSVYALTFYSGSALGVGRVCDRVVPVGGAPCVRPTVILTLAIDHKSLDGRRATALLSTLREILEGDELLREATQTTG